MADTYTTNLNLTKPEPGAAEDTWGISLNADLDSLDAIFSSSGTQINLNPNQINFADGKKAIFGTGSDLEIYHDGSNSYIQDVGTGNLWIGGVNVHLGNPTASEYYIQTISNGAVTLYYDNSAKLATTSTGIDVTGEITADGLALGDGQKATFGASDDLRVYHSSSQSYIEDAGAGNLNFKSNGLGFDFKDGSDNLVFQIDLDSETTLYHNTSSRLTTTSTGIDVTGTATMDGLTVEQATSPTITINDTDSLLPLTIKQDGANASMLLGSAGVLTLGVTNNSGLDTVILQTQSKSRLNIASSGDISFYDSTGTTQGFFWDASDEQLGIGTTNPVYTLDVNSGTANDTVRFKSSDDTVTIVLEDDDSLNEIESSAVGIRFDLSGSEKLRVNSTGIDVTGRTTTDGLTTSASLISTSNSNSLGGTTFTSSISTVGLNSSAAITSTSNSNSFGGTSFTSNIDVTGTVTSDGLTVQGDAYFDTNNAGRALYITRYGTVTSESAALNVDDNDLILDSIQDEQYGGYVFKGTHNGTGTRTRLNIDNNGDISFYDDTGTTQGLFWDAGSEGLGIGTTNPTEKLHVRTTGVTVGKFETTATADLAIELKNSQGSMFFGLGGGEEFAVGTTSDLNGTGNLFAIKQDGKVGIGTTSPSQKLHVESSSSGTSKIVGALINPNSGVVGTGAQLWLSGSNATTRGTYIEGQVRGSGNKHDLIFATSGDASTPTERMRITSAGRLGLGTTNPLVKTHIATSVSSGSLVDSLLVSQNTASSTSGQGARILLSSLNASNRAAGIAAIAGSSSNHDLAFYTNGNFAAPTEKMRILANNGNVGIGTTSIGKTLTVGGSGLRVQSTASADFYSTGQDALVVNNGTANLRFWNNGSERLRIDSSGNLLVGKTSTSSTTVGAEIRPEGRIFGTTNNNFALLLNRTGSDGEIIDFRKDGTTVGNIGCPDGANGSQLVIAAGGGGTNTGVGLRFTSFTVQNIIPCYDDGSSADDYIDLGNSGARFENLYLSGGVYLGGTGSANKLDDYEEGTWTPTIIGSTSGSVSTMTVNKASYTKVGKQVNIYTYISGADVSGSFSGNVLIGGLPFTPTAYEQGVTVSYCNMFSFDEADISISGYIDGSGLRLHRGSSITAVLTSELAGSNQAIMLHASYQTNS